MTVILFLLGVLLGAAGLFIIQRAKQSTLLTLPTPPTPPTPRKCWPPEVHIRHSDDPSVIAVVVCFVMQEMQKVHFLLPNHLRVPRVCSWILSVFEQAEEILTDLNKQIAKLGPQERYCQVLLADGTPVRILHCSLGKSILDFLQRRRQGIRTIVEFFLTETELPRTLEIWPNYWGAEWEDQWIALLETEIEARGHCLTRVSGTVGPQGTWVIR